MDIDNELVLLQQQIGDMRRQLTAAADHAEILQASLDTAWKMPLGGSPSRAKLVHTILRNGRRLRPIRLLRASASYSFAQQ